MDPAADIVAPASNELTTEERIQSVGRVLANAVRAVTDSIPGSPHGPVEVARIIGVDKVLASRVLKATRDKDPIAALHLAPGPDPLRRYIRAAAKKGAPSRVVQGAEEAVRSFETLIRQEAGDRSGFDALLSAWLPEARTNFELRRKQAAFRALSQLKGVEASLYACTVLLHPSADGVNLDVVWLFGIFGLQRLRPGVTVKFASRRIVRDKDARHPRTLRGEPVNGIDGLLLDEFSSKPQPQLDVHAVGEVVHYTLAGADFGPRSICDIAFAEVNLNEMGRYVPEGETRRPHVFAEVSIPAKLLVFDALVHRDVFPGQDPALLVYDTVLEGVASPNDPTRDVDRLDLCESIQHLGEGLARFRSSDEPSYLDLLRYACDELNWVGDEFRGYRCRVDYPLYGSEVVMAWNPTRPPSAPPSTGACAPTRPCSASARPSR